MEERRPLSEMSASTLRHLVAVTLSTEEMCEVMQEPHERDVRPSAVLERLVSSAAVDDSVSDRLDAALADYLGHACPVAKSIGCLNFFLFQASREGNVLGVAAVLWCAARRSGLAWRYFEKRADAALELIALQAISVPTAAARPRAEVASPTAVQVSLGYGDGPPLAHVHILKPPSDSPQSVSGQMSIQLREEELESLYETVGVALATIKLQQFIANGHSVQQKGA